MWGSTGRQNTTIPPKILGALDHPCQTLCHSQPTQSYRWFLLPTQLTSREADHTSLA